jgi:uncharacterized protein (UPF0333 family)
MNKKGQAAMEFLMTYGWAILVVLAAIAALAYFGVLSPSKILPERTTFSAPLPNVDTAEVDLATNSFEISFRNNVGVGITLPLTGNVTAATGTDCDNAVITGVYNGNPIAADTTVIPNGEGFLLTWDCDDSSLNPTEGSKFKLDAVNFDYTNQETGQTKKHTGSVDGKYK